MSITILPQQEIQQQNNASIIKKIPLLFYPSSKTLYTHRMQRLQELAKESTFSDYLNFCANISKHQANLVKLESESFDENITGVLNHATTPLSLENYPLSYKWQDFLKKLLACLIEKTEEITKVSENLKQNNPEQLQEKAKYLLKGQFEKVNSDESLFIWSALSVYYVLLASRISGKAVAKSTNEHWLCPVCNSLPIASVIHFGHNNGLRYLHCSLCESEWYVPRIQCTSCDNIEHLNYFSLDKELAATKTECCEKCNSYLKIFDQDKDPHIEVVADDIASLILDMKTEEEGFAKTGLNPFIFIQTKN